MRRTLTLRFALVSGLVVIALTTSLSSLAAGAIRASVMEQEARQVADQVQELVAEAFSPDELARGLHPSRRAQLDALSSDPKNVNVLRLLLWDRNGRILYSSDRRGLGQRLPLSDGLRIAFAGSMTVLPLAPERLRPFSAETMFLSVEGYLEFLLFQRERVWGRPSRQASLSPGTQVSSERGGAWSVARMYMPVRLDTASAPAAAFEVFYDFRPLERRLARIQRTVWATIPGGFLALYCAALVMVQRTSRVMTQQREDLRAAHLGTFRALASAVDARDSETGDHSGRVAAYALAIAQRLGLGPEVTAELRIAAELHDIGKIGVPDAVLMKPGPLTPPEWELMRQHAIVGSSILQSTPLSDTIKQGVRHVHERWDGRGYPDRLQGEQIPLCARILAVADAFEAMTSDRPYRRALPSARAQAELRRSRGTQFDPQVVDALCAVAHDLDRIRT